MVRFRLLMWFWEHEPLPDMTPSNLDLMLAFGGFIEAMSIFFLWRLRWIRSMGGRRFYYAVSYLLLMQFFEHEPILFAYRHDSL